MDDLSVLDRDDRNEPIVIGYASRENLAVYFVFEDYNATILSMVYNKSVGRVKSDVVAISGELSHQISSTSNRLGPPWKAIAKVEKCVIRNRVEIMLAINEAS